MFIKHTRRIIIKTLPKKYKCWAYVYSDGKIGAYHEFAYAMETLRCYYIGRKPQPKGTFSAKVFYRDPLRLENTIGFPAERPEIILDTKRIRPTQPLRSSLPFSRFFLIEVKLGVEREIH